MKRTAHTSVGALEHLDIACREHGIPVTAQRPVILSVLLEHDDHPTVDQIYNDVRPRIPGVSRTTAYRTLETFADLGLARRTNHFAAFARFDGNMDQHHHLLCNKCGKVSDFKDPPLTLGDLPNFHRVGFVMQDYSVYFEGLCHECKSATDSAKRRNLKKPRNSPRAGK